MINMINNAYSICNAADPVAYTYTASLSATKRHGAGKTSIAPKHQPGGERAADQLQFRRLIFESAMKGVTEPKTFSLL